MLKIGFRAYGMKKIPVKPPETKFRRKSIRYEIKS